MGKQYNEITPELSEWVKKQHMFFVASAPLAEDGHINCSPKGLDSLRILGPNSVAYLDITGSGAETIAHLRENGRIVIMFCSFEGSPKIVRFHGKGEAILPSSPKWASLQGLYPDYPGIRSVILVEVTRVSDSCGFGVPYFEFVGERDSMQRWAETKGDEGLARYRNEKNASSIDGLPALNGEE